ncbi:hypothetical protein [Orenia marismortui]|uniref:Uncharacterized protein n=1 Tax=Orenia marismortui TaxID=46469 RepID=A0A4R8GT04_9FIRM|nr:hypothetical protein [Orenia marismortui]TDX46594.1 hypothetical protein C7959_1399 [Orenia marismortui]
MKEKVKESIKKALGTDAIRNDIILSIVAIALFLVFIYGPLEGDNFADILKFDLLMIAGAGVAHDSMKKLDKYIDRK